MRSHAKKSHGTELLSGWKEIANYMGKGVRTVQRYERELNLPVRRPAGRSTGSVLATKAEVDAWVAASPLRDAFLLTPRAEDFSQGTTVAIRANLAEMTRLREEMTNLQHEIKASVELLHASLYGLRGTLNVKAGVESRRPETFPLADDKERYLLEVLSVDPKRKAS